MISIVLNTFPTRKLIIIKSFYTNKKEHIKTVYLTVYVWAEYLQFKQIIQRTEFQTFSRSKGAVEV